MPIIGAVLQLSEEASEKSAALEFVEQHSQITVGEPQVNGLPIVLDAESRTAEKAIWAEINAEPGIVFSSVVYVDFSDLALKEAL